jgi:hypothetical protein
VIADGDGVVYPEVFSTCDAGEKMIDGSQGAWHVPGRVQRKS